MSTNIGILILIFNVDSAYSALLRRQIENRL